MEGRGGVRGGERGGKVGEGRERGGKGEGERERQGAEERGGGEEMWRREVGMAFGRPCRVN